MNTKHNCVTSFSSGPRGDLLKQQEIVQQFPILFIPEHTSHKYNTQESFEVSSRKMRKVLNNFELFRIFMSCRSVFTFIQNSRL